ncbi:hypothetical protein [Dactylosporangium salmoneum]|uniref:Uncharacterized protein n=1 Tax=Dactylosporangium salmoneum TaxID=53361 RepID=A0ABN3FCS2_9ACTN
MSEFEKTQNNLRVTLEIDNQLTWGELIHFVELGRRAGLRADEPVDFVYDSQLTENPITGLSLHLPSEDLPRGAEGA